jgi:hypothetical protein
MSILPVAFIVLGSSLEHAILRVHCQYALPSIDNPSFNRSSHSHLFIITPICDAAPPWFSLIVSYYGRHIQLMNDAIHYVMKDELSNVSSGISSFVCLIEINDLSFIQSCAAFHPHFIPHPPINILCRHLSVINSINNILISGVLQLSILYLCPISIISIITPI